MSALPLVKKSGNLPYNYTATTGRQFFLDVLQRLDLKVDGSKVLTGLTVGGSLNEDRGLFALGGVLKAWNSITGEYAPITRRLRDNTSGYTVTLSSPDVSTVRTATFQNKNGVVAMAYDLIAPRTTLLIGGEDGTPGELVINSTDVTPGGTTTYFGRLTQDTVVNSVTMLGGQEITIGIVNIGTSFTLDWSATGIRWPGGAPTQPIGSSGGSGTGIYVIRRINSIKYGQFVDGSPSSPVFDADVGGGGVNYGGSGNNELSVPRRSLP